MSICGKIAYQTYYRPLARLRQCWAAGGLWEEYLTEQGRRQMEKAAWKIPLLKLPSYVGHSLTLLTGDRYWYQTVFCLYSWSQVVGKIPQVVIHDDGTLTSAQNERLKELFPSMRLVSNNETIDLLDRFLPTEKCPYLRERRLHYPHLRKLTDVHVGSSGWKLVLDSDLLFFRSPNTLLNWLSKPDRPLHAVDCEESYGYPKEFLEKVCGSSLPSLLNVGLCGLNSTGIDWEKLEYWTKILVSTHGTSYYLEQALVAMLLAGKACSLASAADYITLPELPEALDCKAIMHHYVADSKKWYFRHNWKKVLEFKQGFEFYAT